MNFNDIFFKGILVMLLVCIMTCMYYCHSHINNGSADTQVSLTESEKQLFKEYFNNPKIKDEQDKTYIDLMTEVHAKNIDILMKEINNLNTKLAKNAVNTSHSSDETNEE